MKDWHQEYFLLIFFYYLLWHTKCACNCMCLNVYYVNLQGGEMILTKLCNSDPLYICTFPVYLYHFMVLLAAKELIWRLFVP